MRYSRDFRARQAGGRRTLVQQALAILARYGSAANLYLPGVGAINGITAGNWLDSAGTTAATVDNTVGLVVSAGKAVGPELIDYSSGVLGSNYVIRGTSVAVGGGFYTVTGSNAFVSAVASTNPLLGANKTYKVTLSIQSDGPVALHLSDAQNSGVSPSPFLSQSAIGTYDAVITTESTKDTITALCGDRNVSTTFKVSVRELPGAHLTQSTAANRPVLRLSGGVYAWDFVSSDSFASTMKPGNAGFFCSGANVTDSGVLRTLLGAGAGSDASSGVLLARDASNALTLQVGNGTTRNSVSAAYPVATNAVASAGWDASNMFVGINGTETSGAKTVDCTSSNTINIGVLTGTTNPMLGTIGATIIMPTVLPTPAERAVLRRFIGSLSGVTL